MTVPSKKSPYHYSPEDRQEWLHERLKRGEVVSSDEYIHSLGVSLRTAKADIAVLRDELGAPIRYDRIHGGWRYTDLSFEPNQLYFNSHEAALLRRVLVAGRATLPPNEQASLDPLITRIARHTRRIKPHVFESSNPGILYQGGGEDLWEQCETAIADQIPIEIAYDGAHSGTPSSRVIEPQRLHQYGSEWFLIAYCRTKKALRTFHLGRIREYRLLSDEPPFSRQPPEEVAATISEGIQMMADGEQTRVVVRFSPYQSRWMRERTVHHTQTTTELSDGGVLVQMTVRGLTAVERWVIQYGEHAEVLEPLALREHIIQTLINMLALYQNRAEKPALSSDTLDQ